MQRTDARRGGSAGLLGDKTGQFTCPTLANSSQSRKLQHCNGVAYVCKDDDPEERDAQTSRTAIAAQE